MSTFLAHCLFGVLSFFFFFQIKGYNTYAQLNLNAAKDRVTIKVLACISKSLSDY